MSEVEKAVLAMFVRARDAWEGIDVPERSFVDRVSALIGQAEDPTAALAGLEATDLYLALACGAHHPRALAEFERRYIAEVPRALSRLQPSPDFIAEVQQTLREKLLVAGTGRAARISEYAGSGALGAWVRVAALRTALSLRRKTQAERRPDEPPEQASPVSEPEVRAIRARYRHHLKAAVQGSLLAVPEAERTLLRRHTIDGLTVEQLGAELGVHGSTISRRLARVRRLVLEETRRLLLLEVRLSESELTSVIRVLRSDLDVSVRRMLQARSR